MTSLLPIYEYLNELGNGTFGFVFQATIGSKKYAIKRIMKLSKEISREFKILVILRGVPHTVQLVDCFLSQRPGMYIQNMVFEYRDQSLETLIENHIQKKQFVDTRLVKSLSYQLITGLANIHQKNIVHRDLKPENVLLDEMFNLEICDFGSSKIISDEFNTPYVVSQYYRAPELILSSTTYAGEIDIWAAACVIYELATLQVLFPGESEGDQLFHIFRILGDPSCDMFSNIKHGDTIMRRFQGHQPRSTQTWHHYLAHFEQEAFQLTDLLLRMLDLNPLTRITAKEAMSHPYFESCIQNEI